MTEQFFWYVGVMALTTYLLRMLPLAMIRRKIENRFARSFLAYVPTACLTAMTLPAMLFATNSVISGAVALAVSVLLALKTRSYVLVAAAAAVAVFVTELLLPLVGLL